MARKNSKKKTNIKDIGITKDSGVLSSDGSGFTAGGVAVTAPADGARPESQEISRKDSDAEESGGVATKDRTSS